MRGVRKVQCLGSCSSDLGDEGLIGVLDLRPGCLFFITTVVI